MKKMILCLFLSVHALHAQEKDSTKTNETKKLEVVVDKISTKKEIKKRNSFLVMASAGYGYRLAKSQSTNSPILDNHIKSLKSGFSLDFSGYYFVEENGAIGVKVNSFDASNTVGNVYLTDEFGNPFRTYISDKITMMYAGASFLLSQFRLKKKHDFSLETSLGYVSYYDKGFFMDDVIIKGGNLGATVGFLYHYKITKDFGIGANLSFFASSLSSVDIQRGDGPFVTTKLDNDSKESLSRLDLHLRAAYSF